MTTTSTTSSRQERATRFLTSLHEDILNDNGAKAALKRALSGEQRHWRNVLWISRYLDGISEQHQDQWIFVASLSVYYPCDGKLGNFGQSCKQLKGETDSKGPARRFRALLDTSLTDLHSPLTALVRLMKSKEVKIDYPRLLVDLCQWDHPDQYIQDRWARSFWQGEPS